MSVPCHHNVSSELLQQLPNWVPCLIFTSFPSICHYSELSKCKSVHVNPFLKSHQLCSISCWTFTWPTMSSPGLDPPALAAVIPPHHVHSASMPWHFLLPRLECPSPFAFLVSSYLPFNTQQKIYTFSLKPYPYCLPTGQVELSPFLSQASLCHTLQSHQMILRTTNIQWMLNRCLTLL